MMDVLAEQIELRDLRLGHYIDEILLQLDIIGERLEDEGANRDVIKMAKDLIIRFKAISNRDSQPKIPGAATRTERTQHFNMVPVLGEKVMPRHPHDI